VKFDKIFDTFSKRNKDVEPFIYKVPITLRKKILLFCREVFSNSRDGWSSQDYIEEFFNEIYQTLLYRHGRFRLVEDDSYQSPQDDMMRFLLTCKDEEFLDFVEYIFKVKCLFHISRDENTLVAQLNDLFTSENVGYDLTDMIKETVVESINEYPFSGLTHEHEVIKTVSYPKVIRKDNQVSHTMIIKPALQLLSDPKYKTANVEYLDALEDYKKSNYGDCLTKCCSAFESVMKIICDNKRWHYKQTDTASTLINTVIKNTNLDSYFEQSLIIIATLRNRLSKSHGAGVQPKVVSQNLACYALNTTASAIILLVNETK
jgi:hypothetical protein